MAADIIIDRMQYPARITVIDCSLGYPVLCISDGCFDLAVRLTPNTACALAERLLAHKSSDGFDTGGTGDGDRMQASPTGSSAQSGPGRPVAAPGNDLAAGVTARSQSGDELRGRSTTTPRPRSPDVTTVRPCKLWQD